MDTPASFFSGLKVVELASVLAGPAVGMFFAELGAQVLKVENKPAGGDVTRSWKVPEEDPAAPVSAYYASVNWGKKSWMCDLTLSEDYRQLLQYIQEADIVISNYRPATAQKLGVSYEQLQEHNSRLIFGQIYGMGKNDVVPAFDIVLQAEAGFLSMTGEPGRPPVKMPVALIDLLAAHQLKEGLLLALIQRERSGKGAFVSVSLLEAAIASLANQAANWLMAGHLPQPLGSLHPNIAPYGDVFYTADDKPIVLAAGTERQFQALCDCLALSECRADERFRTNADRVRHRAALQEALAPAIRQRYRDELIAQLRAADVPCAGVRNVQEVFEHPLAQSMILETFDETGRAARCVRTTAFEIR